MKNNPVKIIRILCVFLIAGFMYLFTGCNPAEYVGTVYGSGSSSSASSGSGDDGGSAPSDIMRVYSERTAGTQIPMDTQWEVWPGTGDSVTLAEVSDSADGGNKAISCVKKNQDWLGFTIRTQGHTQNLSGYGFLVIKLKITSDFSQDLQIGLGVTNDQSWFDITETRDNAWHTYLIELSGVTNLYHLDWMFAMRTDEGSWTAGTVRFDDVYYTKTTNHLSNFSIGTPVSGGSTNDDGIFGLYLESSSVDVVWDTDAKMFVWKDYGANADMAEILTNLSPAGYGSKSLRIRCTSANLSTPWFGVGFSVNPSTANRDLTAYSYLNFMYKGTRNFKIGVKDGWGSEAWLTAGQMIASYGLATNDTWCPVKIPLSALPIDYVYVNQYFMICSDTALGCLSNDIHWIDEIYYSTN